MPGRSRHRLILAALGGLLVVGALVADGLRADMLATFGRAQLLLLVVGSGVLFVALAWSRAGEFYQLGATTLVTTALLVLLAELAAGPALNVLRQFRQPRIDTHGAPVARRDLSYVAGTDWAADFWPEHRAAEAETRYEPYVLWRTAPFDGDLTNVTPDRLRLTPRSDCADDSYRIFVFGGSTVWGWGVPDWGTIPAYLQERLGDGSARVCVLNLGENGYVSTQEVIALLRLLQQDRIPDLVLFYDGFNDVHAAFETRRPGVHYAPERIASKLQDTSRPSIVDRALEWSRLFAVLRELKTRPSEAATRASVAREPVPDTLAAPIMRTYRRNLELVRSLGREYGFEYLFFWQPSIYSGTKPLSPEEQTIYDHGLAIGFVPLLERVGASVAELAHEWDRLHDLGATFDTVSEPVWQDFVHLTPRGNRLIADRIVATLAARGLVVEEGAVERGHAGLEPRAGHSPTVLPSRGPATWRR